MLIKEETQFNNIKKIENFFMSKLPQHIKDIYVNKAISKELDQREIMNLIDFQPPFLRTEKIVLFNLNQNNVEESTSLGIGKISTEDTAGHYNNTIFLAMCGWLMASTASIHLAVLFPSKAPQVVEANRVKPIKANRRNGILKPSKDGTTFFIETCILRRKMRLIKVKTKITFGRILYGVIEELKFVLINNNDIWSALEVPEV